MTIYWVRARLCFYFCSENVAFLGIVDYIVKLSMPFEDLTSTDQDQVHYFPVTIAFITLLGSPEGFGTLREARSLNQKVIGNKDQDPWTLHYVHAAVCVWWLSEYSGWYTDNLVGSPLVGVNLEEGE